MAAPSCGKLWLIIRGKAGILIPRVITMIFVCDKCHFIFNRTAELEQCPDCGKYAVRPANEAERQEYEEHLKEFQGS